MAGNAVEVTVFTLNCNLCKITVTIIFPIGLVSTYWWLATPEDPEPDIGIFIVYLLAGNLIEKI